MNLLHVILRQWRQRPARTILSILSVATAVAAVFGVTLAQSSVRMGYRKLVAAVEGRPALEIVAAAGGRFSAGDEARWTDVPGVRAALEMVTRATLARVQGKRFRSVLLGVRPDDAHVWEALRLADGEPCRKPDEALLAAELAENLKVGLGDRLIVLTRRGPRSARIVGLVRAAALREFAPAASLVMPLETVQSFFNLGDQIDRIRVLVDDGQRDSAQAAIAALLPENLIVQAPVDQSELANTIVHSTELALRFAGALTMAMAAFIILNTLRMNFGERRRDIAVMRVLGVTGGQLAGLHLAEGACLGLVGSLVGIPLGLALGRVLGAVTRQLVATDVPVPPVPLWTLGVALVAGPLVACVAALLPAIQSRHVTPNEALGDPELRRGERFPLATVVIGALLWSVATTLLLLVISERLSAEAAIPAGVLMLVGFIAVIPAVLRPVVRASASVLSPLVRMEGGFAADQLLERPTRTGLTVGVLVVAVSTGIGMGNAVINNVNDVRQWFSRIAAGDVLLTGPSMMERQGDAREKPGVRQLIAEQPGVDYVVETRYFPTRANGLPAMCVVHDFNPRRPLPWAIAATSDSALRRDLAAGQAVIGSILAHKLDLQAGDTLRIELQGQMFSLGVAALVRDYTLGGLSVYLDQGAAGKRIDLGPAEVYTVTAVDGAPIPPLVRRLEELVSQEGLVVQSYSDLRRQIEGLIDGVVGALWGLIGVGFVIGGVAVANTLTMSVLEQTRELGLLRIIGMTPGQVRKLVVCESLLLGILGTLMGSVAGITTAWVIHLCNKPVLGQSLPFAFHGWLLAVNVGTCLVITLLAAWSPGQRAARLNLLSAISYE
jgi:putative ABC transport system permease protein